MELTHPCDTTSAPPQSFFFSWIPYHLPPEPTYFNSAPNTPACCIHTDTTPFGSSEPAVSLQILSSPSHNSEILNTPSSLAQSPMPPPALVPVRQRHVSTDSKDSAKKKFFIGAIPALHREMLVSSSPVVV